eukprot:COSAG01_NODE_6189_length_3803_cov_5.416847_3_plen_77_part_00
MGGLTPPVPRMVSSVAACCLPVVSWHVLIEHELLDRTAPLDLGHKSHEALDLHCDEKLNIFCTTAQRSPFHQVGWE